MKRMVLAVLIVVWRPIDLKAEDWPQFRGTNCSGVSSRRTLLCPLSSPVHEACEMVGQSWAMGSAVPVIAAGRVFTSAMVDDQPSVCTRLMSRPENNFGCDRGRLATPMKFISRTVTPVRLRGGR